MEYTLKFITEDILIKSNFERVVIYYVKSGVAHVNKAESNTIFEPHDFFIIKPFSPPILIKNSGEIIEISINHLSFNRFSIYNMEFNDKSSIKSSIHNEILKLQATFLNNDTLNSDIHMIKLINLLRLGNYYNNYSDIKNPLIVKVLNYINENYKNSLSVSDIAEHFYVNSSYLSRVFSETLKISLLKYIRKVKMYNIAIEIIKLNTDHDLWKVYGYNSYESYLKNFKYVFTMSPAEFLKHHKNK